jgi:hypothetical protein
LNEFGGRGADGDFPVVFDRKGFVVIGDAFVIPRRNRRFAEIVANQKVRVFVKNDAVVGRFAVGRRALCNFTSRPA